MRIASGRNADRAFFSDAELKLARIFFDWNPIGVDALPGTIDEYDDLVRPVMIELGHGITAAALARKLAQTITRDYGLAMREQEARGVSAAVVEWWRALPTAP